MPPPTPFPCATPATFSFLSLSPFMLHTHLTSSPATVVLFAATSLRRVLPPAGCKWPRYPGYINQLTMRGRFAFVEYESRRDADDAYHEMHNKRIGRDDLLKIEVCSASHVLQLVYLTSNSGHAPHPRLRGASTPAVIALVVSVASEVSAAAVAVTAHRVASVLVVAPLVAAVAVTTLRARMTVGSATTIVATETVPGALNVTAIGR
ncbi:uncharacterized protein CC84DRAFT_7576 [Paraphaeosphaeria sporulosa]|uniref:RRM domain-containing protein n=1 Tax=Paraphaeosphaeria sporulosa TaxID=1460663 RepID=A0A177CUU5_9PLEO|nr:uncharacterized protein CC84DRAFT_7576 [Paraphaeosphaeria sporulosa]OAG11293.1 hypothetical protein CC84DRAFT_7576 [Paraphaeosphaeria sporulosa]